MLIVIPHEIRRLNCSSSLGRLSAQDLRDLHELTAKYRAPLAQIIPIQQNDGGQTDGYSA